MTHGKIQRIAYVLKAYPRLSETFVVNEILAHEAAELPIEIFSLRLPKQGISHQIVERVVAPVTYLHQDEIGIRRFWQLISECTELFPNLWPTLNHARFDNPKQIYQALLLAKHCKEKSIMHIHAHFANSAAYVARMVSKLTAIPYSLTTHAKDIYAKKVDKATLCNILTDANVVFTVSDYNVAYINQEFGIPKDKIKRIYNGLSLPQFPYQSPKQRNNIIVAVGRLIEKKGFEILVKACQLIAQKGVKFKCQIIGEGHLHDVLKGLIYDLKLSKNVELLGPKSLADTKTYIQHAAVLAAPSVIAADGDRDGLPTVLLESMALGTPCVSSDVTGIPEVIKHNSTGLVVPQHDAAALSDAICQLFENPNLRVSLSHNARQIIETEFNSMKTSEAMRASFSVNEMTLKQKSQFVAGADSDMSLDTA